MLPSFHNYNKYFFLAIIITIMKGLGFFNFDAVSTVGGGIYLHFDHKYFHNNFFFLLPSFHNPMATSTFTLIFFLLLPSFHSLWIIVTIINYIDNKRNSIVIHFLCVVISIISGRGGFIFSCYHNYNNGRFGFFSSCCHKYNRWWDLFVFFLTVQWWRGAIGL